MHGLSPSSGRPITVKTPQQVCQSPYGVCNLMILWINRQFILIWRSSGTQILHQIQPRISGLHRFGHDQTRRPVRRQLNGYRDVWRKLRIHKRISVCESAELLVTRLACSSGRFVASGGLAEMSGLDSSSGPVSRYRTTDARRNFEWCFRND